MATELQEALGVATATTSTSLIQKYIDPLILEYVRRFAPLLAAVPSKHITTNQYFFVERTQVPDAGAVTDGGARPIARSAWAQPNWLIKNYQGVGAVTGFAQAVTAGVVGDLMRKESDGSMKSLMWAVETGMLWGNDVATLNGAYPTMRGLDYQISQFSTVGSNPQNTIDAAGATLTLAKLDELIDLIEINAVDIQAEDCMFVLSSTMQSKVAQLLVANQRFVDKVEVAAGLNVMAYRNIPLIKSSFLANRAIQLGTVTPGTSTTGGSLPATTTYYYQIEAVINRFGVTQASVEVSQATGAGATNVITLGVPAITSTVDPDGNTPVQYKVYRGATTGNETLLGVVDAYDTTGAAVTSIIDTGTNLLTNSAGNTGPAAYVDGNAAVKPRGASQEDIYLIPRDEDVLVRPYVRDFFAKDLAQTSSAPDTLPFYTASDTCLALRAPKYASRITRLVASI